MWAARGDPSAPGKLGTVGSWWEGAGVTRYNHETSLFRLPFLQTDLNKLFASSLFGVGGNDRSCLSTDVFRFG
jgi:hypothetical protein